MFQPLDFNQPDVLTAFHAFLTTYMANLVRPSNIIRGWENRSSLPPNENNYIIYSLSGATRVGTNARSEVDKNGKFTMSTMFEGRVQIDFCSDTDESRTWAAYCDSVLRSPVGPAFFKDYGFSTLYSEDLQSIEYTDGADQYLKRTVLTVHICYTLKSTFGVEYAENVALAKVENVDAHHKP